MKVKPLFLPVLLTITTAYSAACQATHPPKIKAAANNSSNFFNVDFKNGDKFANVYSRAIAYKGDGFADIVRRVSGSSSYKVIDNNPLNPVFDAADLYDGRGENKTKYTISTSGKGIYDGKPFDNTSASGLLYNELIWGTAPATIREGDTWTVNIKMAWELGGPGTQKVTVLQVDEKHQTVTLKREGTSEGFYDGDAKQLDVTTKDGKKIKMDMAPGTSHWTGYTIFKKGIVISDELLVNRPITLSGEGLNFNGQQREYILLNAMPAEE